MFWRTASELTSAHLSLWLRPPDRAHSARCKQSTKHAALLHLLMATWFVLIGETRR